MHYNHNLQKKLFIEENINPNHLAQFSSRADVRHFSEMVWFGCQAEKRGKEYVAPEREPETVQDLLHSPSAQPVQLCARKLTHSTRI